MQRCISEQNASERERERDGMSTTKWASRNIVMTGFSYCEFENFKFNWIEEEKENDTEKIIMRINGMIRKIDKTDNANL